MDKFIDIKEGDILYTQEEVSAGQFSSVRDSFWIPRKVTKVTKAQFELEGIEGKFWKSDGREVKAGYYIKQARRLGETCHAGEEVIDQSEEMKAFKAVLSVNRKARESAERIFKTLSLVNVNGTEILGLLVQAEELIKTGQEEKKK